MSLKWRWVLVLLLVAVPYLALAIAGAVWLYERHYWLVWMAVAAAIWLITWPLLRWLKARSGPQTVSAHVDPSPNWTAAGHRAWEKIDAIAARPGLQDLPLDQPTPPWQLVHEVLDTVAREFHPHSINPVLEIPVPHLLRIVELVAADLRAACSANIPGAHILTINDLRRMQRLAQWAPLAYRLYRLGAMFVNPASAVIREINAYASGHVFDDSVAQTKLWALQFAVKKAGFYAIELYSGHLVLQGVEFNAYTPPSTREAIEREERRETRVREQPLRILILGQVKAGKSSLINALFGETRAAVDVVPRTRHVDPYLLERDGLQRAIILDTAGYEDATGTVGALQQARDEILKCDLLLLTCSAVSAARDADRRLLDEVRQMFQSDPDREFPPLVVALTHIDRLRPFRDWSPPYDIAAPTTLKAEQIREALEVTAADLQVPLAQVVPVCLLPERVYNVDEGLIPAILNSLDAAKRLRYLRCLREYKDEETWNRLRQQAGNAGRIILQTGFHLLKEASRRLDDLSREPADGKGKPKA